MHVVHVEDEGPLRDILRLMFVAAEPNIQLQQFENSDPAVVYIEQHGQTVDLFVLDIRLPGALNGLQIAQKIRDLKCPGFIVMTSAFSAPNQELLVSLRSEYFPKPWHILDLAPKLLKYRLNNSGQTRLPTNLLAT